jgi:hypothetical protein
MQVVLYYEGGEDITDKVKAKLGIPPTKKEAPAPAPAPGMPKR